jgi:hypothetical protein
MASNVAPSLAVRRCYQSAELPVDALVEVLCLLLDAPTKSPSPTQPPLTCVPTPPE